MRSDDHQKHPPDVQQPEKARVAIGEARLHRGPCDRTDPQVKNEAERELDVHRDDGTTRRGPGAPLPNCPEASCAKRGEDDPSPSAMEAKDGSVQKSGHVLNRIPKK